MVPQSKEVTWSETQRHDCTGKFSLQPTMASGKLGKINAWVGAGCAGCGENLAVQEGS